MFCMLLFFASGKIKSICWGSLEMVVSEIKSVIKGPLWIKFSSGWRNSGKSEGFIPKNEKFKHQLDRISRFIRQFVGGNYFCNAQIFSVSRNKETILALILNHFSLTVNLTGTGLMSPSKKLLAYPGSRVHFWKTFAPA